MWRGCCSYQLLLRLQRCWCDWPAQGQPARCPHLQDGIQLLPAFDRGQQHVTTWPAADEVGHVAAVAVAATVGPVLPALLPCMHPTRGPPRQEEAVCEQVSVAQVLMTVMQTWLFSC